MSPAKYINYLMTGKKIRKQTILSKSVFYGTLLNCVV